MPNTFNGENGILGLAYIRTQFIRPINNHFAYLLEEEDKIERILFANNGQWNVPSIVFGIHLGFMKSL